MKYILALFLVFLISCGPKAPEPDKSLGLTVDEMIYLRDHPEITYVAELAHPPYQAEINKAFVGLSQDYINIIESKLATKFVPIRFLTFAEGLDALRSRKVDFIPTTRHTVERDKYLTFSSVYSRVPGVIAYRDSLHPRNVGIARRFAVKDWIKVKHPEWNIVEFDNDSQSMKNVSAGSVDSAVMDKATYLWVKPLSDVPLHYEVIEFDYPYHMAALKDNQMLINIMNKALASVTSEEKRRIELKWIRPE